MKSFPDPGPPALGGISDTGLNEIFLRGLTLKAMYGHGVQSPSDLAKVLMLPAAMVRETLEAMRSRGFLESLGANGSGRQLDLRYGLTGAGRNAVQEVLRQSLYTGPAPVPLAQWRARVERQSITNDRISEAAIARSLSNLVISPDLVASFGPAINSGRGILVYGAPGNGKTSIALAIARSFAQSIWVPYAIEVEGEIIKFFDPAIHHQVDEEADTDASGTGTSGKSGVFAGSQARDGRWVRCRRPVVITGGELSMEMLELKFDSIGRFSEAPLHTKVTNGVLVVDDFGRQIARAEQLLNRWVLPLESRIDYLTLHSGKKFSVAFDGLLIFSTNLTPRTIMDAAMMRRIPYNFLIGPPDRDEYVEIFRRACAAGGVGFDLDIVRSAMKKLYDDEGLQMARFHPRFIIEHLLARCSYEGRAPVLDVAHVMEAAEHLYTKQ